MTGGKVSVEAHERLDAMVRTQNGFEIAELDLATARSGRVLRDRARPEYRISVWRI